jgi:predicted dehydrogenase
VVRIGIIGTGAVARYHIRSYLATPGARVVAVCDILPERAQAVAAEFGIPGVDARVEDLLARPEVDAVSICTPNSSHAPAAIAAARAAKHILCEKPLALTLADADAMLAEARRAGIIHMVNFTKRPFPGIAQLKALLEAGELGEVLQIEASYLQGWLLSTAVGDSTSRHIWRLDRQISGSGVLGDLGSHLIDLGHHLVGPIAQVAGLMEVKAERSASGGLDDHVSFLARFAGGGSGVFSCSRVAAGQRDFIRLEIYGTRGAAHFANTRPDMLQLCLGESNMRHGLWAEMSCALPPEAPSSNMAAFVLGILRGEQPAPSFVDGVRCQAVLTAVEEAAQRGTWQTVEPAPVEAVAD